MNLAELIQLYYENYPLIALKDIKISIHTCTGEAAILSLYPSGKPNEITIDIEVP